MNKMNVEFFKISYLFIFFLSVLSPLAWGKNGFDLSQSLIPKEEIKKGGPPKDGIPAINTPKFIDAKKAMEIYPKDDRAIVVKAGKIIKVYPISILNWHEIVNDGEIFITYCPLCGTGVVFKDPFGGKANFGVSGLLYQSDVLLYDRKTNSLWSQLMFKAISGKYIGKRLEIYPSTHESLHDYLKKNKTALVLSMDTGFDRDYHRSPYGDYKNSERLHFPIKFKDNSYPLKTWTLLIQTKKSKLLVPISELDKNKNEVSLKINKDLVKINYDVEKRQFDCEQSESISCVTGYWFALRTFYPKENVYKNK